MTKPLELKIYWTVPCGGPCRCESYVLPGDDLVAVESVNVEAKRFTDAELAAEFHAMDCERLALRNDGYDSRLELDRAVTLLMFATLPHYDEAQP